MAQLLALLESSPPAFTLTLGVFGLLVGSFLNVVIHRLPRMMERAWRAECAGLDDASISAAPDITFNLIRPRSRCPHCETAIAAYDNIPVLSWLLLRGRCRHCRARIPLRYPLVELGAGLLAAVAAWRFGFGPLALLAAGMSWTLLALALIDYDTQLLPDDLTLPLLWAGLAVNLNSAFISLTAAVVGAMAGYLSLWSVYWAFRLATGKEGMGYGDFKLLAALGAWLGWAVLPGIIIGAALVGAVIGLLMIALGRHARGKPIPFGPFLAAAGWLHLIWGHSLQALVQGTSLP